MLLPTEGGDSNSLSSLVKSKVETDGLLISQNNSQHTSANPSPSHSFTRAIDDEVVALGVS